MNLYVSVAFLIALRKDNRLRHGFSLLLHCGHEVENDRIAPAKVKNVFGKAILTENSTQVHFKSLNALWH
jgi:hypothetical protein